LLVNKLLRAAASEACDASTPFDPVELCVRIGLAAETEVDTRVAPDLYYQLWEAIVDFLPEPAGFTLRCGGQLGPDDYGVLGLAFKTAVTLEGALELAMRYLRILTDASWLEREEARDSAGGDAKKSIVCVLVRPGSNSRGASLANESALAEVLHGMRRVAGLNVSPLSVTFSHKPLGAHAPFESFFGCPVRFGAARNTMAFGAESLHIPLPQGDSALAQFFAQQLEQLGGSDEEMALRRVSRAICEAFPQGTPTIDEVARKLGVSGRTLQRRLAEAETSFQEQVELSRRGLAEQLLTRSRHTVGEIAFLTGFSEQSAFSRAFKRWTGSSPKDYRASNTI